MYRSPSKEMVELLKKRYPAGARVELDYMNDPWSKLTTGDRGTVRVVDDMGTIHVDWDRGSRLGVAFGEDSCHIIEESPNQCG